MALSGMHIAVGYAGAKALNQFTPPLMGRIVGSETMAAPGTSTLTGPGLRNEYGPPLVEVYASADSYLSFGVTVDTASGGNRVFIPAATKCDYIINPGDLIAWTTA